jgi:hypothetical protein
MLIPIQLIKLCGETCEAFFSEMDHAFERNHERETRKKES